MHRRDRVRLEAGELRKRLLPVAAVAAIAVGCWWTLCITHLYADGLPAAAAPDDANALLTAAFRSPFITLALALCAGVESFLIWGCIQTLAAARLGSAFEIVELEKLLNEKRYSEANTFCEQRTRYYTRLVGAALSNAHRGKAAMELAVDSEQESEERRGMDRIHSLGTLAGVALLFGILGLSTNALDALGHATRDPAAFLDSARAAFFPPVLACVVAIPAFLMEATYRRRLPQIHARVRHESGRLIQRIES